MFLGLCCGGWGGLIKAGSSWAQPQKNSFTTGPAPMLATDREREGVRTTIPSMAREISAVRRSLRRGGRLTDVRLVQSGLGRVKVTRASTNRKRGWRWEEAGLPGCGELQQSAVLHSSVQLFRENNNYKDELAPAYSNDNPDIDLVSSWVWLVLIFLLFTGVRAN